MVGVTVVNKRTRDFLGSFPRISDVELDKPTFSGDMWYVLVSDGQDVLGVVVLDVEGNVEEKLSYPNTLDNDSGIW